MKIFIQAVQERLYMVKEILDELGDTYPVKVHVDTHKKGAYWSFLNMAHLKNEYKYRIHIQDDVRLAKGFVYYIPEVEKIMSDEGIHVLALYSNTRIVFRKALKEGRKIVPFPMFWGLCCVAMSEWFIEKVRKHYSEVDERVHDDIMVREIAKKIGVKIYAHIPNLAQHLQAESASGHKEYARRKSNTFDNNWIINQNIVSHD